MKKKVFWRAAQFFEIRWWRGYLRRKNKEEYYSGKQKYWNGVLELLYPEISAAPGSKILDAGCGPAGIFTAFPENQVTAVDPLLNKYELLEHFNPEEFPNTTFVQSPLEEFPASPDYDIVFCLNVINHVNDLNRAVETLSRCLAPGGKLALSVDVHRHNAPAKIFRALKFDVLHPHQYSAEHYRRMIESSGILRLLKQFTLKRGKIFDYEMFVFERAD